VTQTLPSAAAPTANDETVIDVPAARAPAAAMSPQPSPAATGEGAGFEVPAEEAVPVPIPAPTADGTAGAAPAVEMPAGGDGLNKTLDAEPGAQVPPQTYAPEGIILQDGKRKPTAQELVHLQSQQNFATLSSRLGMSASQLSPADLMPEEVAKYRVTPISATAEDQLTVQAQPASVSMAALPGQNIEMPVTIAGGKTVSQLSLPPATVGPLSLRLAAANGDPSAAFEVGARLAEGKGTTQNFQEAMNWYQKSAAQGFAQAQYRLGTLYERGLGTKADLARAQMWYQRAAEQGNVKAMHNLAVLSAGRSGSPDYTTAARWFQSAADYGLSDSQYNLAVLFENGLGVTHDPVQAYKWYALAGRGGDAESVRRRDALKSQMTADQRLRGDEAVATFDPKRTAVLINDARAAGEDWKKRQDG
jgi:localization factor PodJL